jgi:hypothetical protein
VDSYRASGGGGGGRIALVYNSKTSSGPIAARGGNGYQYGAAGTVYEQTAAQGAGYGTVRIDNNSNTAVRTHIPPATNAVLGELHHASIVVTNRGGMAVTTSATVLSLLTVASTNESLDLGANGTVLTVSALRVNGANYTRGGLYTTNNWNQYTPAPANVTGAGAILLQSAGGMVFTVR